MQNHVFKFDVIVLILMACFAFGYAVFAAEPDHPAAPPLTVPPVESESPQELTPPLSNIWPTLSEPHLPTLDEMIELGEIRILTTLTLGWFYIEKGRPKGKVVAILTLLQDKLKKRYGDEAKNLKLTPIPVRRDQLIPFLIKGYGDVIMANQTITPERAALINFSSPWRTGVNERLISNESWPKFDDWRDLAGRTLMLRTESSYFASAQAMNRLLLQSGYEPMVVLPADPRLEDEDLVAMVANGILDATIMDEHKLVPWLERFANLKMHEGVLFRENGEIGFGVRQQNDELKALLDDFVGLHPQGSLSMNLIALEFLLSDDWLKPELTTAPFGPVESLIQLFQKYAKQYDFDWVLLAAFSFQESGFNNKLVSRAGAVGVMQVMPATGKELKVGDIKKLENNVHAGVKYLSILRDRYFDEQDLDALNRALFSMAAYNAGPNRINRLRKLAEERGRDPDKWFNNVEDLALADIGIETVTYVTNLYRYYISYKRVLSEKAQRDQVSEELEETSEAQSSD